MRLVGLSLWIFLNLILLGTGTYLYLLWVQYWRYAENNRFQPVSRNYTGHFADRRHVQIGGAIHEIEVRPGRPLFHPRHHVHNTPTPVPTQKPTTTTPIPRELLLKAVEKHKMDMTVQLRTSQRDGGSILKKHENRYGVRYRGHRLRKTLSREEALCGLREAMVRSLRDGDEPFTSQGVAKHFPSTGLLEGRYFNSCAVVSSAGSLKGSKLGNFIDSHDAVVRFNHAPTEGFEDDVGSRTTLRIVNSQVVTKPEFNFWESPLYRDVALLLWDPCNYTATLDQWYSAPDFDLFPVYFRRRLMMPQEDLHLLHPTSLWNVWDVMQRFSYQRIQANPPSSGFLGVVLMLAHCETVDTIEFVPSLRVTKQCHYWDATTDQGCTFGGWHPLASEKLLSLALNVASDEDTFSTGFVRIPGFRSLSCPSKDPGR
ncbi:beta-galactoside alpha-2,6-sialyltransferase 2-like [Penaeus japonicus]|uniref:beta-galactoside alpha-2,6-sialyltransferase 2-like n=1 Tax=Penaeus japonicus TaxID=27405 RepID=UPI001C710131|nr:beta-galactoside alpha-2,6-sialyltransferase 2-like [Penaeus japonicus]